MKKYAQADFENFEIDKYGYRICPSGDYTAIKNFGERCIFGENCSFGEWCIFGKGCSFGENCSFGRECSFGERCSFGEWCSFGDGSNFEAGAVKNGKFVAIDRIGTKKRKAYFFIDDIGKMYVRAGCWFSGIDEFKERVQEVHVGTIHEKTYLAACDLAELMLKEVGE